MNNMVVRFVRFLDRETGTNIEKNCLRVLDWLANVLKRENA